jgi:CCR4-NOT transcription complex subunit 9
VARNHVPASLVGNALAATTIPITRSATFVVVVFVIVDDVATVEAIDDDCAGVIITASAHVAATAPRVVLMNRERAEHCRLRSRRDRHVDDGRARDDDDDDDEEEVEHNLHHVMASPTAQMEALVAALQDPDTRENALLDLSKKRDMFADLAPTLWFSFGVVPALLQEIVAIYPLLNPPSLTNHASNRVCNALALLQCVASHPDTRGLFLAAHIPLFLYPFLNTVSKTRPFEYLRLTSLGVIGALVKMDDTEVINFLLSTEIIPLCLRTMELGSELSKTVATFIVQKILSDEVGLSYICATAERCYAVGTVLGGMVTQLAEQPSVRLLKHIIRCYLRLSDNPRARECLRQCFPDQLRDPAFTAYLKDDVATQKWLVQLLMQLN